MLAEIRAMQLKQRCNSERTLSRVPQPCTNNVARDMYFVAYANVSVFFFFRFDTASTDRKCFVQEKTYFGKKTSHATPAIIYLDGHIAKGLTEFDSVVPDR